MAEQRLAEMEELSDKQVNLPWAYFRLSPFPQIAIRVMQMVNKDDVPLDRIATLIAADPAFASEILTIANSPLYAPRIPATSILQAVSRLGTRHIQGLCLTVAVRAYLGQTVNHPIMKSVWHHNLACAMIAEQLAVACFMDKDLAYTAGVMHDIGRLAMAVIKPKQYSELLGSHTGPASSILEAEWALFGFDHCEAGQQLIASWKLPHDFDAVVAHHHATRDPHAGWEIADLVSLSCRMADISGFAAFPGCEAAAFSDLQSEIPEEARGRFHPDIESLSGDIAAKISAVEAA